MVTQAHPPVQRQGADVGIPSTSLHRTPDCPRPGGIARGRWWTLGGSRRAQGTLSERGNEAHPTVLRRTLDLIAKVGGAAHDVTVMPRLDADVRELVDAFPATSPRSGILKN